MWVFIWGGRGLSIMRKPATRGRRRPSGLAWYSKDFFLASRRKNSANVTYFLDPRANFLFGSSPSHHP